MKERIFRMFVVDRKRLLPLLRVDTAPLCGYVGADPHRPSETGLILIAPIN